MIIIDHLSRWPSLFALITSKALLWVTAAEGFVAISGLLVGYIRGYKNRELPFKKVALTLIRRGVLLYIWSLIASIAYVAIIWYFNPEGGTPSTPMEEGAWGEFLPGLITMRYTFVWVHFLTLYAIFLVVSPVAIWLFRQNLAWVVGVLSLLALALGWTTHNEPLQWQFLFFIPSIVGFYLVPILNWWKALRRNQQLAVAGSSVGLTIVTIGLSILFTYHAEAFQGFADYVNAILFDKESVSLFREMVAFLWFSGFFFVFYKFRRAISRYLNWLLIPFGTHSLTAYILHGVGLLIISYLSANSENYFVNTLLGFAAVLITWGLIKIPLVRRIVPA